MIMIYLNGQRLLITNFERLRDNLERCQQQGIGRKQTTRLPLPPMKDQPSSHSFCVGIDEANRNIDAYIVIMVEKMIINARKITITIRMIINDQ